MTTQRQILSQLKPITLAPKDQQRSFKLCSVGGCRSYACKSGYCEYHESTRRGST